MSRICSGPGCLRSVPDGVRFCDECKPKTQQVSDGIKVHKSGYDPVLDRLNTGEQWRLCRASILKRDPICKRCDRAPSEIVDHIVPAQEAVAQVQVSGRYPLNKYAGYYLKTNLQGLCRPCHHIKTMEDKAHTGPWPDVLAKEDAAPKKKWTF